MRSRKDRDDDISSFEDLYFSVAGSESQVAQVLTGNLAVEFLLRKLISQYDPNLINLCHELSHAKLVSLARDLGLLSSELTDLLVKVNSLRNRFAHHFAYTAELSELIEMFRLAQRATSDYSELIAEYLQKLLIAPNKFAVEKFTLAELFLAVIYDLHQQFVKGGGDEEELKGSST